MISAEICVVSSESVIVTSILLMFVRHAQSLHTAELFTCC